MSQQAYNQDITPPIPNLDIALSLSKVRETIGPLHAIVDSGADATLIPKDVLKRLGARAWGEALLRGPWGESRHIYTYVVDIHIKGDIFPGIEVVGDDLGEEVVLGRNLLNKLILLLDGPETTLYTLPQRPRHLRY